MAFRSYRAPSFNFLQYRGTGGRVLQRRCACGNKAESEGECTQCAEKQGMLQRKERAGGPAEVPSIVHDVLHAPGQPLDIESQSFMEAHFGYDFSGVRVHADEHAHRSADATNAEAYTVGHDIVFASGRYAPQTPAGRQLLAHELTHVVQQGSAPSSGPITMGKSDDYEVNADRAAAEVVSGRESVPAIQSAGVSLQRQPAAGAATTTPTTPTEQPCLEAVVGEDIPSLLQAGVLTIIEFGAEWCKPCKQLQADLGAMCQRFREQPPPVTVRFYSIDIEAPGNEEASQPYVGGGVPHLYFFVGSTEKAHYNSAPQPDVLEYIVAEQIEYASTSGAARGAKKGLGWGALAGGLAGIGGAIAIGTQSNLEGNALMGGILGSIVGGAAVGLGLGAAIGAIAGAAGDDRNKGPKEQKRKKLQKKSRTGDSSDREEREADLWASHVVHSDAQSMDTTTRGSMERQFNRDFSHVRIHRDEPAQSFARGMDAYAVTRGSDIYFASDAYAPGTPFGRSVIGHELAHVVQNDFSGPTAGVSTLETEAAQASQTVAVGEQPSIQHGSNQSALAMTRGEHTAASTGIGAGGGAAIGAGIGAIAASQMKDKPFGEGAGIGAAIGGGLGLIGGLLYGYFARNTDPESTAEAEALIQQHYGKYLRGGATGPLHNAVVNPVTQEEICERMTCRGFPCDKGYVGWTDTGVPIKPAAGPTNQKPPIPDQASEPTCNGKQMTHATPERPVIYYVRDSKYAGTLIHEGLHAHSHPDFIYLHRHLNEGVTEYFTRKLQDEINMPYVENSYDDEVVSAKKLVSLVGEEQVAQAYFGGAMPALHQAFNSQFGPCALITWAFHLEAGSEMRAASLLENRNQNYCQMSMSNTGMTNAELTPAPPAKPGTQHEQPQTK